jgi:tetratricopeptide (TPR) repeat protein
MQSHHNEGREWLEKVLSLPGPQSPPLRARALNGAGVLARGQGDFEKASTFLTECLEIQRSLQDKNGIANVLNSLGILSHSQGDHAKAIDHYQESLKYRREIGDTRGIAASLHNLSMIYQEKGEFAQAEELLNESLTLSLEIKDTRNIAATQLYLGYIMYELEDVVQSEDFFRKSLVTLKDLGGRNDIIECLEGFAGVAALLKQPSKSAIITSWRVSRINWMPRHWNIVVLRGE